MSWRPYEPCLENEAQARFERLCAELPWLRYVWRYMVLFIPQMPPRVTTHEGDLL